MIQVTAQSPLASAGWFAHGADWAGDPDEEAFALPTIIATTCGRWGFHGRYRKVEADSSNLVLGRSGETYRCRHHERIPGDRTFSVSFDPELLDDALPETNEVPRTTRIDVLLASIARDGSDALRFEALVVELLLELRDVRPRHGYVSPAQRRAVAAARECLDSAVDRRVTLLDLAAQAHLSPFHLHRLFATVVGVPPHEYLTRARMRHALELLAEGCSVTEVSTATATGPRRPSRRRSSAASASPRPDTAPEEGLAKRGLCRRAALLVPRRRPQSRPYCTDTHAPCVLASERPSHPGNEQRSTKPS